MPILAKSKSSLFHPFVVEPVPGRWWVSECDIRESAVDLVGRQARVPKPHTEAQRKARFHEMGHVKWSPRDWKKVFANVVALAAGNGDMLRLDVASKIGKMMEENRIDWLMWSRKRLDIRDCREVLDWKSMKPPTEPYRALGWVLQLAWTVWGSKGLGNVVDAPPSRALSADVEEFFDACWAVVEEYNDEILPAMVSGCMKMYADPTHQTRDRITAELASFFPPVQEPEPDEELPPPNEEEKKAQEDEEEKEREQEKKREEEESGAGAEPVLDGQYEIHDHTASIKRPSMRIARKERPVFLGTKFTFFHRYMMDKAVFSQRLLTEGGIMIDGSGSMSWTDQDMEAVLAKMPAVTIGRYSGIQKFTNTGRIYGRICILAKKGRFSMHVATESDAIGSNDVDLEALKLLATWPKPRLWLSDGLVCGGRHDGPHPDVRFHTSSSWMRSHGKLVVACNKIMQQNEILRVPHLDAMHQLLKRQRVTLYGSCVTKKPDDLRVDHWTEDTKLQTWPDPLQDWPVTFCL